MAFHIFTSYSVSSDLNTARAESSSSYPAYVLRRIHTPRYVPYALSCPVPRSIVHYRTPRTGILNWTFRAARTFAYCRNPSRQ